MNIRLIVQFMLIAGSLLLAGCAGSLQEVKVDKVHLCDRGHCSTLGVDLSTEVFLSRTYSFLSRHAGRELKLAEVDPKSREEVSDSITYFTQGGPLPFYSSLQSLKFIDVSYLDREKKEIGFKSKPGASFLGVPILCAEGEGTLRVISSQDVQLETSSLCTWLVNPVSWQMKLKLDQIDLDRGFLAGHYTVGHGGPTSAGKGSGYQVATLKRSYSVAASQEDQPHKKTLVPVQVVPTVGPAEQPRLAYTTVFSDANRDSVLDAGEKISLLVDVHNYGASAAKDVTIVLGGTPYLTSLLGAKRTLGVLAPQEHRQELFEAVLPARLEGDTAELRIEVYENGKAASETRTLRLAARSREKIETIQVLSQLPQLQFALELKDQNGNRILEGGEEVALLVEVSNQGQGPAEDVQLRLSGSRSLVALFGAKQPVGDLAVGSRKRVEMRGVLPQDISSESAELRVELSEKRGFAPSESRILRVATKGQEHREVVEVISELSVDDIPPKVRGYEKREDFAVLIGISSYRETAIPEVKYARRDAEVLAKYFEQLSGIPKENIAVLTDGHATKSDIEAYLDDWLPRRVTANSRVFLFYAGHGAPEPEGKGAFIVPYEGHPDFSSKMIPLSRVYDSLNRLKAREVVVFLDSCFSGAKGRSVMQQGIRPLVMSSEHQLAVKEKPLVMAASSGSEVTSDLDNARHGLFTYYLLKGLRGEADRNGNKRIELDELFAFVSSNVTRTASRELNRTQTPVMLPTTGHAKGSLELSRTH